MKKFLVDYKGVIILLLVLSVCIPVLNSRVEYLNRQYDNQIVSSYEK